MRESEFRAAIADWQLPLPHPRFGVYRNNVRAALATALAVRYPVTQQLVGEEFFAMIARDFAAGTRPSSPVLIDYGAGFPDFIRGSDAAGGLPYLADVAALESLWWKAYHAGEVSSLGADALARIDPETLGELRIALHPSLGLLASSFAVGSIWQAHHGGTPLGEIQPSQAQCVLVARPAADVILRVVPCESFDFLHELGRGAALAEAVEAMLARHPGFDIAAQLGGAVSLGLITGFFP